MAGVKLKAATLLESVVAMVVVLLCFGIASMIYVNVMSSDQKRLQLHAHLLLKKIAIETKEQQLFLDEIISAEGVTIEKKASPHDDIPELVVLHLTAINKEGKIIISRKELICTGCNGN